MTIDGELQYQRTLEMHPNENKIRYRLRLQRNPNYLRDAYENRLRLYPDLSKIQYWRKIELHGREARNNYERGWYKKKSKDEKWRNKFNIRHRKNARNYRLRKKIFNMERLKK